MDTTTPTISLSDLEAVMAALESRKEAAAQVYATGTDQSQQAMAAGDAAGVDAALNLLRPLVAKARR